VRKVSEYSHLGGLEILKERFKTLNDEIDKVIAAVTPEKTKVSLEKTKKGKLLYNPKTLNADFEKQFRAFGWTELRDRFSIPTATGTIEGAYKQVDFVKQKILCEVQLGKYAFMFYDLAKFQYFYNKGQAELGVEIVPSHNLQKQMSSGVSYGEQLIYDLERIGRNFPSVPVKLILVDT
jgi:hypothetical protein